MISQFFFLLLSFSEIVPQPHTQKLTKICQNLVPGENDFFDIVIEPPPKKIFFDDISNK